LDRPLPAGSGGVPIRLTGADTARVTVGVRTSYARYTDGHRVTVHLREAPIAGSELPESIVHYASVPW
jgi:hypothetical protein